MKHSILKTLSCAIVVIVALPGLAAGQVTPADARAIAKDAYIYGFPLVDGYRIQKSNSINDPVTGVQVPSVYNRINDPGERWNLREQTMGMGWVLPPVTEKIAAFQQSVAKVPNIALGEEFKAY